MKKDKKSIEPFPPDHTPTPPDHAPSPENLDKDIKEARDKRDVPSKMSDPKQKQQQKKKEPKSTRAQGKA